MRVLIAGGGTGGHLYPGIAIAEEITRRPGGEVLFVGTARGLESKLVPAAGFPLELIEVSGLNRVGTRKLLKGVLRLPMAFVDSRRVLQKFRPDMVIGVGGYASGPLVLTAAWLRYPTAIQEQNSHPGFTNRVLGRFVQRVFVAFEEARGFFACSKTMLVGNPVRRRFLDGAVAGRGGAGPRGPAESSRRELPSPPVATAAAVTAVTATAVTAPAPATAESDAPLSPLVLVVGGSQGARAVNDLVLGAAAALRDQGRLPRMVHQTGPADEARVRERYRALGLTGQVEVRPYIDDMPAALAASSLAVGRAGALTLAELATVGLPAILIPLPTAADDHQTQNAAEFARAGAAVLAPQAATTPAALARLIDELCGDESRRLGMGRAMAALARPEAARRIVDELERVAIARQGDTPSRGSR